MIKQNKIKVIVLSLSIICLLSIIYLSINNRIKNTASETNPTQNTIESIKRYTNNKYGFSFSYPANLSLLQSTDNEITIGSGVEFSGFGISVEPTTFINPGEKVIKMNKESTGLGIVQIINENINIDGHPAIVTSQASTLNGEIDSSKKVFFIKDKLLFTISTWKEDNALWSSFKFTK